MEHKSNIFECDCIFEIFYTSRDKLNKLSAREAKLYINRTYREISIAVHPDKNKEHPDLATKTSQELTSAKNIVIEWINYNDYQEHDDDIMNQEHECEELELTIRNIGWLRTEKQESYKRRHDETDTEELNGDAESKRAKTDDETILDDEPTNSSVLNQTIDLEDEEDTTKEDSHKDDNNEPNPNYTIIDHTTRRGKAKFQIEISGIEIKDWIPMSEADPKSTKAYLKKLKQVTPKRFINLIKRKDVGQKLQDLYMQNE